MMHDGKVLVVEDEPVILLDLDFALTNAGFNVVATSNAAGVMSTTMEEDIQMARTGEARALGQHRSPVGHRIRPNQGRRVSCATMKTYQRPIPTKRERWSDATAATSSPITVSGAID
ncbi:hypothetical protein LB557_06520 [Mesorhizobium sp. BR115XR7A]|uniref:hypothetical protein n=1 Tax=unclassified Mesorhizobium TaxID=325217 RepID=UPI00112881C0|nr:MULTISPECIES: hypothetical protein [unclassified Mesorhizobium]MBZ9905649.1 hypothetical protein [Mesorhizobium sp. BR115XR7A]MBZ9931743.1 hypothetical protein [Mesorhizobium sp. BR1-1-5]TPL99748.1 hypothetical protein FJ943_15110 [Mesorhizobium sp. B2-3-10]